MATARQGTKRTAKGGTKARARKAASGASKRTASAAAGASKRTATAASTAGTRSKAASRTAVRWTEEQVQVLMDAVKASPTAKAGFESAARELGKTVGTVQQKYYALQRKAGGGRRSTRGRASAGTARSTSTTRAASGTAGRGSTGPVTQGFLAGLTADELVKVADLVRGEVQRRQQQLKRAAEMFR